MKNDLILMAEIVGVHGVRGALKLKVFSAAPEELMGYAPFTDAAGTREFVFTSLQPHRNVFLAEMEGVSDRAAAEKLRGTKLYVPRERLPEIKEEGTYYHADLIGLAAKGPDGTAIGRIVQVANFGAGDLLEIKPAKGASYYVPFTNAAVPEVNLGKREATVIVPPGLLDERRR